MGLFYSAVSVNCCPGDKKAECREFNCLILLFEGGFVKFLDLCPRAAQFNRTFCQNELDVFVIQTE